MTPERLARIREIALVFATVFFEVKGELEATAAARAEEETRARYRANLEADYQRHQASLAPRVEPEASKLPAANLMPRETVLAREQRVIVSVSSDKPPPQPMPIEAVQHINLARKFAGQ